MRRFFWGIGILAFAGTLALGSPQDRDDRRDHDDHRERGKHSEEARRGDDRGERHDNGKHNGWAKHEAEDRGEHHDNGNHNGWYKHGDGDDHRNWDYEHDRIIAGRHYPHGHYEHVREVFVARSIDFRTRRVILYDRSNWVVASYDVERCRDWQWDHDQVYVYDDDHHPGWYLLFNARLGRTVHVEFSGVR